MIRVTAAACALALVLTRAPAAELPGMFDQDNPAFATCANDVPPEIRAVNLAQDSGLVEVEITAYIDIYKTGAFVSSASVFHSEAPMKSWSGTAADQVGEAVDGVSTWAAGIGPFAPGTELHIRVMIMDSEDNAAVQVPALVTEFPPPDEQLFRAAHAERDAPEGYPANMDIIDLSLGFDATHIYVRMTLDGPVTGATGLMPNVFVIGFRYPDLRKDPVTWDHELTSSRMMAYIPRLTRVGFFADFESILGGSALGTMRHRQSGHRLYFAVERALLNRSSEYSVEDMDREGFKMAAGTLAADIAALGGGIPDLNAVIKPTDCTGYSMVYYGGLSLVVE